MHQRCYNVSYSHYCSFYRCRVAVTINEHLWEVAAETFSCFVCYRTHSSAGPLAYNTLLIVTHTLYLHLTVCSLLTLCRIVRAHTSKIPHGPLMVIKQFSQWFHTEVHSERIWGPRVLINFLSHILWRHGSYLYSWSIATTILCMCVYFIIKVLCIGDSSVL